MIQSYTSFDSLKGPWDFQFKRVGFFLLFRGRLPNTEIFGMQFANKLFVLFIFCVSEMHSCVLDLWINIHVHVYW